MKRFIWILLCFFSLSAMSAGNELLEKAEKAYDSKKYKEAIASYEELISQGYRSFQLYYNLGNAYYRNNELGKSIYYYELARKLEPADEDVRINLAIASAKTIDKIDSRENFFISAVKTNLLSSFSTDTWAWFSIISLFVFAVLFFVFIDASVLIVKRFAFTFSIVFFSLFLLTYFLGNSALRAKYDNKFAIITAREVRVMNEPTATATSKFTLHEGTKIRVVENNGVWLLIKLDNGNEGWLKMEDVGII
jgi:tetratricopeptide (TPR) repeat protein